MRVLRPVLRPVPSLGSLLARLLVVRTAILLLVGVPIVAGHALGSAHPDRLGLVPAVGDEPTWGWAEAVAFPDCLPISRWDRHAVPSALVVRRPGDSTTESLTFDRAWRLNHNALVADDVQVLGVCL